MNDKSDQQDTYPIDASVIRDLFGDDDEIFRNILLDFIAPTTSIIVDIKKSIGELDGEGVRESAHNLKSAARSVGALDLGDLCQTLEFAGKNRNWAELDAAGKQLDKLARDVFEYIRKL